MDGAGLGRGGEEQRVEEEDEEERKEVEGGEVDGAKGTGGREEKIEMKGFLEGGEDGQETHIKGRMRKGIMGWGMGGG